MRHEGAADAGVAAAASTNPQQSDPIVCFIWPKAGKTDNKGGLLIAVKGFKGVQHV
jgi:hypothetical protein